MNNKIVQNTFDYSVFDQDTTSFLQETEDKIVGRTQRYIKETGRDLLEAKMRIGHGHFVDWIHARFDMSEDTAQNLMNVARNFGEIPNGSVFADRALYLLSRKSTPDDARQEAKDRAVSGEEITFDVAKEIVETKKALKQQQDARIEAERKVESLEQQLIWSQAEVELTKSTNENLEQELETRSIPEVQTIEVPTDPADVKERMEKLKDWHKKAVDEREKAKKQVESISEINHRLSERNKQLSEESRRRFIENMASVDQLRIRQEWRMSVDSFQARIDEFMRKVPNPIDRESFEADDWARYMQCINVLEHAAKSLKQQIEVNKNDGFVDGSIDRSIVNAD